MALSAFRSTTKRSQVGPSGEGGGTPAKGRRAHTFSDPNSKYFSDSSSMSDPRYGDARRARASSRRFSMDSESDADGSSKRYQRSRRSSREGSESDGGALRSLRRSSSQSDFSKQRTRKGILFSDKETSGDEMQVEERTIRAVHAQMKQLRNKHPTEDLDMIGLYDAMKAEVRQAISDLKQETRQSAPGRTNSMQFDEAVDLRKEYAEKLDESERRANDLWSELADEEQRCVDLAKLVKDLLPDASSKVGKRAYRSKRRQMVSQSLDEDARRFFDECVSVSRLDCNDADFADADRDMSERSSVISTEYTDSEVAKVSQVEEPSMPLEACSMALGTEHKTEIVPGKNLAHDRVSTSEGRVKEVQKACEDSRKQTLNIQPRHVQKAPVKVQDAVPSIEPSTSRRVLQSDGVLVATKQSSSKDRLSNFEACTSSDCSESSNQGAKTENRDRRRAPVNVDGIVMPWLEWETGSESSRRSRERAKHNGLVDSANSSTESASVSRVDQTSDVAGIYKQASTLVSSSNSSSTKCTSGEQHTELLWDSIERDTAGSSESIVEVIPQRLRFKHRISSGRMHLCMGVF